MFSSAIGVVRLVRQGAAWLVVLLLMLLWAGEARAQADTTVPALTLNAADGSTTFTSLPATLSGSVFDAGGMGRVDVALVRIHSAQSQSWNGTAWGVGTHRWLTTIAAPNADHTSTWSATIPWPGGSNLPRGRYALYLYAWDAANNLSFAQRPVLIGAPDGAAPALSIVSPVDELLIDSGVQNLSAINGTANDGTGSGVAYVQVQIAHTWGGIDSASIRYWNGSAWGGYALLNATLGASAADGTHAWSLTSALPPPSALVTGRYRVTVFAYDRYGNRAVAAHNLNVTPRDEIAPQLSVLFPAQGQTLTSLPEIRGTASDEGSGLARLDVYLRRTIAGSASAPLTQYWDGSAWSASFSYYGMLLPRYEYGWSRNQNLPAGADLGPGDYLITAQAFDRYNNVRVLYRNFAIVPAPPLSIDAHLRAAPTQSWLGEGFSNGDASGQTLSDSIQSGQSQTRQIRIVRNGGLDSKTVKVTIPDWAAFAAAGWSASFTDAGSGADISAQITSAQGWQSIFNEGQAKEIAASITAPASATAGQTRALTLRVEAAPGSETPALDVIKATWNVVAPTPDLAINAENGAWQGANVRNTDGAGQSVERVAGSSHVVRGQIRLSVSDAPDGQPVKWSVPDWDAFRADGWSARFFDAPQGGQEITGQITGEGWSSTHTAGYQAVIAWEVMVPASASDVTRVLSVRAQIEGGVADVVKASVRVLPDIQPDLTIRAVGDTDWLGTGVFNATALSQTRSVNSPLGQTQIFEVALKNTSALASSFTLHAPVGTAGWELHYFDAPQAGTDITSDISGTEGWQTPSVAAGATLHLRLEVTMTAVGIEDGAFLIRASAGASPDAQSDAVKAVAVSPQFIARLQYSVSDGGENGQRWLDVPASNLVQVVQGSPLSLRAVPGKPQQPWPDDPAVKPEWTNGGKNNAKNVGAEIAVIYDAATGRDAAGAPLTHEVRAESGNTRSVQVQVLPFAQIRAWADADFVAAVTQGTAATPQSSTYLVARVTDWKGQPLSNIRVQFATATGQIGGAGTEDDSALTNANGYAKIVWTAGTAGNASITASIVTSGDGAPVGLRAGEAATIKVAIQ